MPQREVITLSVGQAGIQLGTEVWKQYLLEHNIGNDGMPNKDCVAEEHLVYAETFFEQTNAGKYVSRSLNVDLENSVLNDVRNGANSFIYGDEFLLNGNEDAANNFARGHYTIGKEIMDQVNDRLRKLVDNSQNVQGFMINHSVGGGTGSGLGMLILERCAVDYRKKSKIGYEIYPSPNISTCIVEPYNALLSTHWLLDHTDVSLVLDNEAVYGICQSKLEVGQPSYVHLNRVICKVISSMTAALRFDGELNVDMNEFQTNLVPFPRLHFMTTSLSPITSKKKAETEPFECKRVTFDAVRPDTFLVKYTDFDPVEDKYMAISLNYRGDVPSKTANAVVQKLKVENPTLVSFVDWCPTGFKIGLNKTPAATKENDDLAAAETNVVMVGNNIAVNRVFQERISKKYDMMYSQRAYVFWYVGEGMEEGEFSEAREDLGFLEKDYIDVVTEKASDEEDDEYNDDENF